jgi:hypothetical protein
VGSDNLKTALKLQIVPDILQMDSVLKAEGKRELVIFRNGKLAVSDRALAKLINGCKRGGKISDPSNLLLGIQKKSHSFAGPSLCSNVIGACINLGWLEMAHDILDDLEAASPSKLFPIWYMDILLWECIAISRYCGGTLRGICIVEIWW